MERTRAFTNALIDLASSYGPESGSVATVARTDGRVDQFSDTLGWASYQEATELDTSSITPESLEQDSAPWHLING